jgi:hypothetical protein
VKSILLEGINSPWVEIPEEKLKWFVLIALQRHCVSLRGREEYTAPAMNQMCFRNIAVYKRHYFETLSVCNGTLYQAHVIPPR